MIQLYQIKHTDTKMLKTEAHKTSSANIYWFTSTIQ